MTPRDLKSLQSSRLKSFRYFAPTFLACVSAFNLVVGIINLRFSAVIAGFENATLRDIWDGWIRGIDINATYSGVYLKALERMNLGLVNLGFALCFLFLSYGFMKANARNRRILSHIESLSHSAG